MSQNTVQWSLDFSGENHPGVHITYPHDMVCCSQLVYHLQEIPYLCNVPLSSQYD